MQHILHRETRRFWFGLAAGAAVILFGPVPTAWAHKIYLHAEAVGQKIEGRAYFRGGAPAQESKVEVFLPDGRKLLETKTDANGEFSFPAPARCDYRLVVDTGDGHGAETILSGADLPESLPPLEKAQLQPPEKTSLAPSEKGASPDQKLLQPSGKEFPALSGQKPAAAAKADASALEKGPLPDSPKQWQELIEQAVRRQVQPLARKIEQLEDRLRWSDVLGGIGYIVGLTGMGFYLLGIRKNGRPSSGANPTAERRSSDCLEAP